VNFLNYATAACGSCDRKLCAGDVDIYAGGWSASPCGARGAQAEEKSVLVYFVRVGFQGANGFIRWSTVVARYWS